MDCSPPGSSVHEIFLARILEWVAISPSRGSSRPRHWTQVSRIADGFLYCRWILHWLSYTYGERNGNPLPCSCLENPRDGGAWWAAVSGVAQSRTRLKLFNSSSRMCLYFWFLHFNLDSIFEMFEYSLFFSCWEFILWLNKSWRWGSDSEIHWKE